MGGVSNKTTSHIARGFGFDLLFKVTEVKYGHLGKSTKSYYSWTKWLDHLQMFIIGSSNKHTWHNTPVFDLTYFSRSQWSKFETNYEVDIFCYDLTWKVLTLDERVSRHYLRFYQILAQSDFKYGHQVAILEKQLSAVTPELMTGSSPRYI
jgi:hypothetical protein